MCETEMKTAEGQHKKRWFSKQIMLNKRKYLRKVKQKYKYRDSKLTA